MVIFHSYVKLPEGIWILKPPRKSVSSNLAFSQDTLLSESIWYILSQIGGFAPASTSWIDLARHRHKKWYGELTEFRGPHFCCNFHEENEVLIHWKGGVPYFQTKPCCELPIWIFRRAILVSHPEKQSKAVALICMDASASPNTNNINQPTPLLTLPILSLVWCITV